MYAKNKVNCEVKKSGKWTEPVCISSDDSPILSGVDDAVRRFLEWAIRTESKDDQYFDTKVPGTDYKLSKHPFLNVKSVPPGDSGVGSLMKIQVYVHILKDIVIEWVGI